MIGSRVKSFALALFVGFGMTLSSVQTASAADYETHVVRLKNPSTFLNCRAEANTSSRIVTTYKEGMAIALNVSEKEGIFYKVWGDSTNGGGCYVSGDFVQRLNTHSIKGLLAQGVYQVTATDLNRRAYASTNAPVVGKRLQRGTDITVVGLGFDKNNQSWLKLSTGEFVVGTPSYFIYKGSTDPTCNYFVQACN